MTSQLATYVSQNRQQLSKLCVQSQARLVLDRLEGLGGGTEEAARRRGRTAGEEMGQGATGTGAGSQTRLEDPPDWRLQTIKNNKI